MDTPTTFSGNMAPLCACGCGKSVRRYKKTALAREQVKGEWAKYLANHNRHFVAQAGAWKDRNGYAKLWRQKNIEYCRIKDKEKYSALRLQVLTAYSGGPPKCACCGESGIPFLTIDHIVPIRRKTDKDRQNNVGTGLYARLRANNYPPGFQVLCFNCNCAKRTLGECPHKSLKAEPIFEHYPLS